MPDPEGAAAIRRLSGEAARTAEHDWEREAAARTGGLPVYANMGGILVVTAEGIVLRIDDEQEAARAETDPKWIHLALVRVARRDPSLRSWAPVRPAGAAECSACRGTGAVTVSSHVLDCGICGTTGWLA